MKKIIFPLLITAAHFLPQAAGGQNRPTPVSAGANIAIVPTEYGKVRGYIHNGTYTYKGIPYAQAQRFMAPQKPAAWDGIRSSMTWGPVCPLTDPVTRVNDEGEFPFHHDWGYTSEDCLCLNIWSPGINDGKKRPVMVWLHGGGFSAGSSQELPSYDGESLSKKGDVVVVSVNHRLNLLGFLDLSAYGEKYKANAGMLDLVVALEWVKNNVSSFGGDPGNVTIFGQSGGGGKVTTLMNAPSAKGLFHKAIIQSGSSATFMEPDISSRITVAVLDALGLQASQVDSLQRLPLDKLSAAGKKALQLVGSQLAAEGRPVTGFGLRWNPVRDGSFLPWQPSAPEALAISAGIPTMIGTTKNEFMNSWSNPALRNITTEQAVNFLKEKYKDKADAVLAAIKKAYPTDTRATDLIDIDDRFRLGAVSQANMKSANSTAPVYMYLFTWQSPVFDGGIKATHCMELPFVFNNIARCEEMTGGGKEAYVLADKMSQAWINFSRSGNPNHKKLPKWQPYTAENGATMIFDNKCVEKYHHDRELLAILMPKP